MNTFTRAPSRSLAAPPQLRTLSTLRCVIQRRFNSTHPSPEAAKTPSPTSQFYKTFTRPVAKVLLMATFTYQLAYWGWVRLEKDEIKARKTEEITALEAKLQRLTDQNLSPTSKSP
ncbi:hypothetical protein PVAG01_09884 [Phlyctema vagabunda]|uniref:Inner membrane assembly complex subunit 17 n=1 Tax=Phlyctema vagabunda TaxID=108571 RepID=A0ABR4P4D5_9HELO